ncbi:MAG: hypothetical protein HYZ81_02535 [Nitrospinae bacterium]|nr:hypothetical protein [Nitrospinota bacterium]
MTANREVRETLRTCVGMVIPVWFPEDLSPAHIQESLLSTLDDCDHYLPWEQVLLVIDGDERSHRIARDLQASCQAHYTSSFDVLYNRENRGKGYAVCLGTQRLLEKKGVHYLTIRDADGDHALNDLVHLLRLALHLQSAEQTDKLLIIGRRNHPNRTLGFVRGEYETLLNRVLVEAVCYTLAQQKTVLKTQYFPFSGDAPDLHSGYKLYSRSICELMVQRPWELSPWVGGEIYRYGVEAVPFVEGALAGAIVGEITRLTREARFTGHSGFAKPETNAGVMLWTFLRLGIGPQQGAAILDNHLSRLTLWTDPRGREDLLQLRRFVLEPLFQAAQLQPPLPQVTAGAYF